jgi:hypothetical protein
MTSRFVLIGALATIGCTSASAQDIAARVATMRNGEVRLAMPARPDVCGDGEDLLSVRGALFLENLSSHSTVRWKERCNRGPLRVRLTIHDGVIERVRASVSGSWDARRDSVLDLGMLPASVGANYLLSLGESLSGRPAARSITAAALVDSVTVWPGLLRIARLPDRGKSARREALFWLSVFAGDKVTGAVEDFDSDAGDEKSHALFVLHELRNKQGIPELLRIAREHRDPQVRRRALFWLSQDGDPRAIDLFEQILRQR